MQLLCCVYRSVWTVWALLGLTAGLLVESAVPDPPTSGITTVGSLKLATAEDCAGVVAFSASKASNNVWKFPYPHFVTKRGKFIIEARFIKKQECSKSTCTWYWKIFFKSTWLLQVLTSSVSYRMKRITIYRTCIFNFPVFFFTDVGCKASLRWNNCKQGSRLRGRDWNLHDSLPGSLSVQFCRLRKHRPAYKSET